MGEGEVEHRERRDGEERKGGQGREWGSKGKECRNDEETRWE